MRILYLYRQMPGDTLPLMQMSARALADREHTVELVDATSWMPSSTEPKDCKKPSAKLLSVANGFDVVHAWGYRTAWACADAFRSKRRWMYTVNELPRTTHADLIDRLSMARAGICTSYAVHRKLETAWCIHIQQRYPGIEPIEPGDKELARIELKLDEEEQLVVALIDPRNSPEQAELLDREFPRTKERVPYAKLQLVHDFEAEITKIHAADLVVSVSKNGAVSVPIAQAMSMRKVVMIPQEGALPEMVEDRLSGMVFSDDDLLGDSIASALQMPLTLETMENAARIRFNERFAMDDYAEWLCELYLEIAN